LLGYARAEYPEYHAWLEEMFESAGIPLRVAEEHDASTSLVAAVEAGRGIALVPESFACFVGARLNLRPLVPRVSPMTVVAARVEGDVSVAVRAFVEAAKAAASEAEPG
jgi:DNA-binding transcriptional LysR family regulator